MSDVFIPSRRAIFHRAVSALDPNLSKFSHMNSYIKERYEYFVQFGDVLVAGSGCCVFLKSSCSDQLQNECFISLDIVKRLKVEDICLFYDSVVSWLGSGGFDKLTLEVPCDNKCFATRFGGELNKDWYKAQIVFKEYGPRNLIVWYTPIHSSSMTFVRKYITNGFYSGAEQALTRYECSMEPNAGLIVFLDAIKGKPLVEKSKVIKGNELPLCTEKKASLLNSVILRETTDDFESNSDITDITYCGRLSYVKEMFAIAQNPEYGLISYRFASFDMEFRLERIVDDKKTIVRCIEIPSEGRVWRNIYYRKLISDVCLSLWRIFPLYLLVELVTLLPFMQNVPWKIKTDLILQFLQSEEKHFVLTDDKKRHEH